MRAVCRGAGVAVLVVVLSAWMASVAPAWAAREVTGRSAVGGPTAALEPGPGQYFPVRTRVMSGATIAAKATTTLKVAGVSGVPSSGLAGVAINFAVKGTGGSGGLIVYPSGVAQPAVTGVRYRSDAFNQELMQIGVGPDGQIKIANTGSVSATVFADVHGYVLAAAGTSAGSTYVPLNTARIEDKETIPAGWAYVMEPLGKGGIPASGVSALAFSLVAKGRAAGKLKVFPSGTAEPVDTVLDYQPNVFLSNMVFGKLGTDGGIVISNYSGTDDVDVYVDVAGYFAKPGAAVTGSTSRFVTPVRAVQDTSIPANGTLSLAPLGKNGVPGSGVNAVGVNLTAKSTGSGSLRVYPSDQTDPPSGGSVDYLPNDYYAQYVPAKLGPDGKLTIKNASSTAVTVSADIFGYFAAPTTEPGAPADVVATAGDQSATVTWRRPADGGSAITGFTVTPHPFGEPVNVGGNATTATLTGLTNGQEYTFTVTAVNAVGRGPESEPSNAVTPRNPDDPIASFTVDCERTTRTCRFDGSASQSPHGTISDYIWSFGDGGIATGKTSSYTYPEGGTYTVFLTVTDDAGRSGSASKQVEFGIPPVAAFTTSCNNATLTCTFDASDAEAPDGTITRYDWDLGDGSTGTGMTISHTYPAGSYTVRLKITDSNGLTASTSRSLTIGSVNKPPLARFTSACDPGMLWCGFDALASADPDGEIVDYAWDFGDGTTSSGVSSEHTYTGNGTYTVTLTVTDNTGATAAASQQVQPGNAGGDLQARFSFLCLVARQCDFDATGSNSTGATIVEYQWDFGDGTRGGGTTPSHAFPATTPYTVRLTIIDDRGRTATTSHQVIPQCGGGTC
jgi:PKD repeat protein